MIVVVLNLEMARRDGWADMKMEEEDWRKGSKPL